MCAIEEGTEYVPVTEFPEDALNYLYRKLRKTNNSILREGGSPRWEDAVPRLRREFEDRGLDVPDTSLTREVVMRKDQALDAKDDVPGIIKIGSAVGDYEYGTLPKDMTWSVLVTEGEAAYLEQEYENVRVSKASIEQTG